MSLEQSISEHAAAVRELADSIVHASGAIRELAAAMVASVEVRQVTVSTGAQDEVKASAAKKPGAKTEATGDTPAKAAIKQALADAEAKKKAQAEADAAAAEAQAEDNTDGSAEDEPVLDYETDVKPKLQTFLRARGRAAGEALLKKYGIAAFSEFPKDRLRDLLADLQAAG